MALELVLALVLGLAVELAAERRAAVSSLVSSRPIGYGEKYLQLQVSAHHLGVCSCLQRQRGREWKGDEPSPNLPLPKNNPMHIPLHVLSCMREHVTVPVLRLDFDFGR